MVSHFGAFWVIGMCLGLARLFQSVGGNDKRTPTIRTAWKAEKAKKLESQCAWRAGAALTKARSMAKLPLMKSKEWRRADGRNSSITRTWGSLGDSLPHVIYFVNTCIVRAISLIMTGI